jgi:hypothetical protein
MCGEFVVVEVCSCSVYGLVIVHVLMYMVPCVIIVYCGAMVSSLSHTCWGGQFSLVSHHGLPYFQCLGGA